MPTGLPIIISVTELSEAFYGNDPFPPSDEVRTGPDRDARSVRHDIFDQQAAAVAGMRPPVMIGSGALAGGDGRPTRERVVQELRNAAASLTGDGDTLFVYYSGHGARLAAGLVGDDERNVFCLEDGFLLDVELRAIWASFAPAARIVFVADCCHAADIVAGSLLDRILRGVRRLLGRDPRGAARSMADTRAFQAALDNADELKAWHDAAIAAGGGDAAAIRCAMLIFAASSPDEILVTPKGQSPFAARLIIEFVNGAASYVELASSLIRSIGSSTLSPVLEAAGRSDPAFASQIPPFTL